MKFRFDGGETYLISQKQIPESRNSRFLVKYASLYIYAVKGSLSEQNCYDGSVIRYMDCFLLIDRKSVV